MYMYKCINCGHLFEEGEQKGYCEGFGELHGKPATLEYSGCPICGETYEKIEPCKICGGYESIETLEEVCNECKNDIVKRFKRLLDDNFTADERYVLNDLMDGEEL